MLVPLLVWRCAALCFVGNPLRKNRRPGSPLHTHRTQPKALAYSVRTGRSQRRPVPRRTMPAVPASPPGSPTKGKSLKVRAIIKYGVKTTTLTIPCGDGKKTVRWLGVVAAQRFVLDGAARGRVRQRERGHAPGAAQVLPRNVATLTEQFAHPDALVKDVVRDGGDVFIELDAKVALDAKNAPTRSNWQVVAFKRNDEKGRAMALADEYAKREASKAIASMKVEMIAALGRAFCSEPP